MSNCMHVHVQFACMPMLNCIHVHAQFLCMFMIIACIPMYKYMHVHIQFHPCLCSIACIPMSNSMNMPHVHFCAWLCSMNCILVFEFHACPCMMMCLFMFQCILIFKFHHFHVTICLSHGHFVNIKAIYIFIYKDGIVWPYFVVPWLRIGQPQNISKTRHGVLVCLRKFSLHTKQLIEGSKNWNSINYYNWAMDAKKKNLNLRILLFQFIDFSCIFYSWFQCHHLWPILTLPKSVGSYFNKRVIWLLSKSMNLQSQYMLMVYDSTCA